MNAVFVDTLYWVASINPKDQWHEAALQAEDAVRSRPLVTTEAVLVEVLNYFCAYGAEARQKAVRITRSVLTRPDIEVVVQTPDAFSEAVAFYEARPDKKYSLTDCLSMNVMRERGITEVLTHDDHFTQEGFTILL